ncbi:unnamed protein product [Staurois parvus]|uniref:Uncharacterized protein n=1 Tax=Staurois parvus TaxID=386267 RepID=A0ABN9GQX1_9NEOB|nr:unnamed protein product [Staurois parvus]
MALGMKGLISGAIKGLCSVSLWGLVCVLLHCKHTALYGSAMQCAGVCRS